MLLKVRGGEEILKDGGGDSLKAHPPLKRCTLHGSKKKKNSTPASVRKW